MGSAQAVRQWQVGDVNVNFGVYSAASTLLISSATKSGKIQQSPIKSIAGELFIQFVWLHMQGANSTDRTNTDDRLF